MDRLLAATLNVVRSRGEQLFLDVSRPYAYTLVARIADRRFIVKVAGEVEEVGGSSLRDIRILSALFGWPALGIASSARGSILPRGVVYQRESVNFVSLSTFVDFLEGRRPLFKHSRGRLTTEVDGEELRRRREELGLSLGALASELGVSRETLYRYERGEVEAPHRVAVRLARLGINVLRGIDLDRPSEVAREDLASREVSSGLYRLVDSHPDAVQLHEGRPLLVTYSREKAEKTRELGEALGAEVEVAHAPGP